MTEPDFLADVEHRCGIALTFSNNYLAAHWDGVHHFAHRLDCYMVGVLSITLTHGLRGRDGRSFNHPQEIEPKLVLHLSFLHKSPLRIIAKYFLQTRRSRGFDNDSTSAFFQVRDEQIIRRENTRVAARACTPEGWADRQRCDNYPRLPRPTTRRVIESRTRPLCPWARRSLRTNLFRARRGGRIFTATFPNWPAPPRVRPPTMPAP